MQKINIRSYIHYKLANSLYAGAAMGSIFVIYASLPPALFSAGGVALAFGGWLLAFFYMRLMKFSSFFVVGFGVELVSLALTIGFLRFGASSWIAFFVYFAYQFVFLFGNYLVRAETKLFRKTTLFAMFDRARQLGYLGGLGFSFLFYEWLGHIGIVDARVQIGYLYWSLFAVQIFVLFFYTRAFGGLIKAALKQKQV